MSNTFPFFSHNKLYNNSISEFLFDHISKKSEATSHFNIDFYSKYYADKYFPQYGIDLPESMRKSSISRKSEFLAGRYAAKLCLKKFGIDSQVLIGENREPVWPNAILGSITHTDETAICIVTSEEHVDFIGVDLENLIPESYSLEIAKQIVCKTELELFRSQSIPLSEGITLAFSAKESFFKAIYPSVKFYFDFHTVTLDSICIATGRFTLGVVKQLDSEFKLGTKYEGYFLSSEDRILTLIIGWK